VFPFDQIADVGVNPSRNIKLISREIILEVFQTMLWSVYLKAELHVAGGLTDRPATTNYGITPIHCITRALALTYL